MIAAEDLRCWRGAAAAPALVLDRLHVPAGSLHLLSGPTGCGKSTVALIACGAIPQVLGGRVTGTVAIAGCDPRTTPVAALAERLALLQQDPESGLVTDRADDEVAFPLENRRWATADIGPAVAAALAAAGAEHLATRRLATLSCGELQRVALAAALAVRPSALVLDEPLAFLDAAAATALLARLRTLADAGHAVLVIEHRRDLVRPIADAETRLGGSDAPPPPPAAADQPGPTVLAVRGLRLARQGRTLLDHLDLELPAGGALVLAGANGSGKTSLLLALLGLLPAAAERLDLAGLDPRRISPRRLGAIAALVLQNPDHQLRMPTVAEEVAWGAASTADRDAELAALDLAPLAARHPLSLSLGQRRRLTLAAALARRPRLLLLDEPTVGQDDAGLARLLARLAAFRADGGCLIAATHDRRAARALAATSLRREPPAHRFAPTDAA